MYRNADGAGHGFGDKAVQAASTEPNRISCFGSVDMRTGRPVALILNKMTQDAPHVTLTMLGRKPVTLAEVYRYSGKDLKSITRLPDVTLRGGQAALPLPASSITLLRAK
jgi:hypothetical protein